jgi:opacity protein-like surface antigen
VNIRIPAQRLRILQAGALAVLIACTAALPARGQGGPTAARVGDLQIGAGFVAGRSAYNFTPIHMYGEAAYTTFDWKTHYGAEFNFHNIRSYQDSTVYERTYQIGPRVYLMRGPFLPYAKVLYGRGVYNFAGNVANVAYNMYTFGGGIDLRVRRSINVRADYEYQNWMGFPLGTLHPSVVTIGVAYHFHE